MTKFNLKGGEKMKIAFRRYSRFLFLFYLDIVVIILIPILFVCFPNDFDFADDNTLVIVYFYPYKLNHR